MRITNRLSMDAAKLRLWDQALQLTSSQVAFTVQPCILQNEQWSLMQKDGRAY